MPMLHRHPDDAPVGADPRFDDRTSTAERAETVATHQWDLPSMLAVAAGVTLVLFGAIALIRAGVDGSWFEPVVEVAGVSHTALLGAIELGVGALLVLTGLARSHAGAAFVALLGALGATVAAVETERVSRELAIEERWAVGLAIAGFALALLLALTRERYVERRVEHRHVA